MKRVLLAALAAVLLAVPAVQAQKLNKEAIQAKLSKSDADIADAKKSAKAATWLNRGKVYYEAASAPVKDVFVSMEEMMLKLAVGEPAAKEEAPAEEAAPAGDTLLERKNIVLNCAPVTPEEAIRACGRLMVESGYVDEAYIQGMLDREASFSVAIGSHVAIPHGTNDVKPLIKRTGVVVMTYPEGIDWNGDKVKLVVGIAAKGGEHLEVLGRIVAIASTDEDTDKLVASADAEKLFKNLNGIN